MHMAQYFGAPPPPWCTHYHSPFQGQLLPTYESPTEIDLEIAAVQAQRYSAPLHFLAATLNSRTSA